MRWNTRSSSPTAGHCFRSTSPPRPASPPARPTNNSAAAVLNWLQDRIKSAGKRAAAEPLRGTAQTHRMPVLEDLMRRLQGNRWAAARWLGLNRATVRKKLRQHGLADIHRDDKDDGDDDAS
ncbi:MAG: helix-turn-helix domain-containing protein [Gemmataceae bacterium]